ncbi:choline-responsive transcriptional repressor BetI [Psychromarinibacter halotolerans]|uniref:HTH-type transcriptional regulator BetI n=1 Tax=Psychromarinibacter halotolerans TaxID=1775175 RepID=A0ABV7GQY4_9RHOB|nr:transcriptional regulator BetI [Psychromarinibacter halotolerans]MDF0596653.1 transcriptional regulator BetI [Psychromarinibacter halotolerans]
MPKLGMEPIRRAALVKATIDEIGTAGTLDVTVGRIARRAGVSSALAHHYFGGKDDLFLAAMRHILTQYGAAVQARLSKANGPRERLDAVVRASFEQEQFSGHVVSAWLNFYVAAQSSPRAQRLLKVYQRRLRSNLVHDLRPLVGARAPVAAETVAALIDGLYIRAALAPGQSAPEDAAGRVLRLLDMVIAEVT